MQTRVQKATLRSFLHRILLQLKQGGSITAESVSSIRRNLGDK